jgi:hypothetical protein
MEVMELLQNQTVMKKPLSLPDEVWDVILTCWNFSGEFHHQADAEWIVIRGPLRGHNNTPCGRPTPGRLVGRLGVGSP